MNGPSTAGEFTPKQTLQPGELAQLCRVDVHTIRRWSHEGKLPSLRTLGNHRRYLRRDLAFLPQHGDPQLLTFGDVAGQIRVAPRTVSKWVRMGKLRSVTLPGGRQRLIASEVAQLLTSGLE